jgi:hypothetical protein
MQENDAGASSSSRHIARSGLWRRLKPTLLNGAPKRSQLRRPEASGTKGKGEKNVIVRTPSIGNRAVVFGSTGNPACAACC